MFERIAPSEADKDAEAALGRSPDQIAALRLAAMLLVANILISIVVVTVLEIPDFPLFRIIIGLVVAYYLYRLRPRAETFAQGVAVLSAVLVPLMLLLNRMPLGSAILESLPTWGVSGALLLLLTGDPKKPRRIAAVALFCVVTVGIYALAILAKLAG